MTLDADGLRCLIAGVTAAGLWSGCTTLSGRGWLASLLGPAVGVAAGLALQARLDPSHPALPWAGLALCALATLAWWAAREHERRQPPAWAAGTWLGLHLLAAGGAWLGLEQLGARGAQLGLTTALGISGLLGAWSARRVPVAVEVTPAGAPGRTARLETPPVALALAALALLVAWRGGGVATALPTWPSLALVVGVAALWAGRLEAAPPVLLPGLLAALGAAPAGSPVVEVALGLGACLGLRQAAAVLAVRRGRAATTTGDETFLGGLLLSAGAASLALAEDPRAAQAALPLAAGLLLATLGALAWTGPALRRMALAPRPADGLAARYRWLGAWTALHAAWRARRDPVLRRLPELIGDAREVLVAGSGSGLAVTRLAAATDVRLRAVELDPGRLTRSLAALTPEERSRVTALTGDLRQVELGRPDVILLLDVLQAWPPAEQRALLERLAAALPRGGRLLFRGGCPGPDLSHGLLEWGARLAWRLGLEPVGREPRFASATDYGRMLNDAQLAVTKAYPELGSAARLVLRCAKV